MSTARPLSDSELDDWEEAYAAVEAYLRALRIRNRLLIAELVRSVLQRAATRMAAEPGRPARLLAMEEVLTAVADWTRDVLEAPLENRRLAARGRLALLLVDMPGTWQGVFLTPPPWPESFAAAMKSSYLAAGPAFAELNMVPMPLEFNAFGSGAAQWWETMDRRPIIRIMFAGTVISLIVFAAWYFSK
ncbi:MAG: hypothetical protein V4733_11565 [Verrucomicrobiota bacterium]